MRDYLCFLNNFLRHPVSVGAVAPSSSWLGHAMIEEMDLDRADTIVELGPGTGAFTRVILESIRPEANYLALELNSHFAGLLRREFPRVRVVNDSAESIGTHVAAMGGVHVDCIFCGLPWASFGPALQSRVMTCIDLVLKPGGRFATFAYVHAAWFPTARRFHRLLKQHFSTVTISPVVWRNLPPAFVYRCTK